jgi:hypothetical protein
VVLYKVKLMIDSISSQDKQFPRGVLLYDLWDTGCNNLVSNRKLNCLSKHHITMHRGSRMSIRPFNVELLHL